MQNQHEPDNKTLSTSDSNDNTGSAVDELMGTLKFLLFAIGGVALLLSIWVLLPMFMTYVTEGDYRAPSEIHPTDSVSKANQNNNYDNTGK